MRSYKFTEELDRAIIDSSYEKDLSLKKMCIEVGLNPATYFVAKRRGVLSERTLHKIKKIAENFDFSKLEMVESA